MDRRNLVRAATLGGVALAAANSAGALGNNHGPANGGGHKNHPKKVRSEKLVKVAAAAADCINVTEVCVAHCQELLATGDTSLAECLQKTLELLPLCEATKTLANYGSALTAKQAKVCLEACEACYAACEKHAQHHDACKACAESCKKCAEACKALI